jgi:hypoxanthine phosphoribosyltransferase
MKLIYSPETIHDSVEELAEVIRVTMEEPFTLVGILKGAYAFLRDLSATLGTKHEIDFIIAHSYQDTKSTGVLTLEYFPSFKGKNVVLVEDIIDTGKTTSAINERIECDKAITISLLRKEKECNLSMPFSYAYGLTVPEDCFVVGYGLDYNGYYRNLSGIYELEEADCHGLEKVTTG